MNPEDFQPKPPESRNSGDRFVEERTSDRMGLVTFAGQAVTQAPLTLDHEAVKSSIARIEIGGLADGTADRHGARDGREPAAGLGRRARS
jgi:Ca-activated chloride channel family protein